MNASSIHIDTYYFYDNSAGYSGGAIYVGKGSGNCVIENSVFANNFVDNATDGHGGAIEWYAEKGSVLNSSFTNNYAYNGGAIYVGSESGQINVTGSTFTKNHALTSGGAISLDTSAVIINQTKFYDNYAVEGGALYVGGDGETNYVYDSVFKGNNATGGNGGAINWIASSGTIINSNLTSNHAYYGGGLYFGELSANSVVSNCIFTDNHAKYNGGAIDCNSSQMTLTHTLFDGNYAQFGAALCRESNALKGFGENNTFKNNHAYVSGAALGWMGSVGITIVNYTFINNSADFSGGAIYVSPDSHNCSIIDCNFEENYVTDKTFEGNDNFLWNAWNGDLMEFISKTADLTELDLIGKVIMDVSTTTYYHGDADYLSGVGGAIDILASNATVKKSSFTNNSARLGGAIYVGADNGNTNINDSIFTANHAYERGGAINLRASAVSVNNSKFFDNTAIDGGALFVSGSGITNYVLYSVFEGNNATGGHGGAIEWIASEGYIEASNFTRNSADYGGALYFNGASHNSSVINVRFEGNNATYNGGAIDWDATGGKLYNNTFISNHAGAYGAALCRQSGATGGSGKNNTFIANHADIGGAALAWMGVSNINIDDYHFINNTANGMGGAIYIDEGSNNCVVNNSYFTGNRVINSTGGYGGAISIIGDDATIINSNFTDNSARYGGAIFAGDSSGNTNISNALFERNQAVQDGGAVQIRGSGVSLDETRFYNNTAVGHGGAIYVGGTGENNVIYRSEFTDNEAGDHGGAIDWIASAGEIKYSNFTRNSANYGGAIYLNGVSSHSELANLIFTSNTAHENGGAIDCNATMMNLTNTQFISNHAKYGAASCREANASGGFGLNNTFIANEASVSGAAIAWLGVSNININNYTFINNTAGISGGAVYVKEGSDNCKVRNSTFENNYVTDVRNGRGGAIDWIGSNGHVEDTLFKDSLAVNGGTIYIAETADNFTVLNTAFISSRALGEGGSLLIYGDNVRVLSSNFTFSLALVQGGSISTHNIKNITINDCIFDYNVGAGYVDSSLRAYGEGGAIYANNITLINISNSKFSGIESHSNGGAISAINCNDAILYNLIFNDELTIRNGGAISWVNSTNVTIDSSRFNDVSASYYGGAIYLYNMDGATVKNSVFNGTITPRGNGGAIYSDGNTTLRNNTFVDFEAYEDYGGAIFVNSGNSTIADSRFDGRDPIWVYYNATAYVTNNNVTGNNPNKNMYYLERDYDTKYNPVDYSVWNDGNLYLKDNNFDYVIFNNGTIWTNTTTKLLDNKTWNVTWNENFTYWAQITDDNNNTIISVQTLDTYNDVYLDEGNHYILKYNRATFQSVYQGTFHLAPIDKGLKRNTVYNGTLNVKMPLNMEVTYSDLTKDTVTFTAKITPKVTSNYTISGKYVIFKIGDLTFKAPITGNDVEGSVFTTWNLSKADWKRNVLSAGTYTVTATFEGDNVHWGVENSTQFTVNMRDTWIRIMVNNVVWGQYPVINVTTNGNGTVVVSMNGRSERLNVTNGTVILPLDALYDPGVYYISAIYLEDEYYKYQFNETNFTIYKQNTTIDAIPTNITVGQSENITVNVDKNATGYIKVTIEGQEYIATIVNGTATFSIPNLFCKNYQNVEVLYNGDIHFNGNKTYINFTVGQSTEYPMDVKVNNIEYGQNATVYVKLPTLAEGNVTIYVDGIEWGTVTLNEGTAELSNISGLTGGEHFVNVTYHGGVSYAARNYTDVSFNVTQTNNWKMTITVDEHPYGENTTIHIVTNPYNVINKNLTITIDGHDYVVNITEGVAELTLNNLSAKVHMATVYYSGDANYTNMSQKFSVQIAKAQPTVNITRIGTDVIATVSGNAIANVTFYINGIKYDNLTVNGNATLHDKLCIGINSVVAIYNENENYTREINITTFDISRIGTSLTVVATPETVGVGKNTTVTVTMINVTSGNVLIEINGYNYTANINSSGVARLIVALPVGNYTARAFYLGDNTHFESNNTSNAFNVTDKQNATVIINAGNVIEIDGQFVFNVTNSTPVVVTVNGKVVTPVNGNYAFDADKVGNYTIVARSGETDDYYAGFDTKTFVVVKHNSTIRAETEDIEVGQTAVINVTGPLGFDGIATVNIAGVNYTVILTNGIGQVNVTGIGNGTHPITVTYLENEKYMSNTSTSAQITVSQVESGVTVEFNNITYGEVAIFNITVTNGATGNVTVKVGTDIVKIIGLVNGKVQLIVPALHVGEYDITVTYNGDNRYKTNYTVDKLKVSQSSSDDLNVIDLGNGTVVVNVPANATGNITVKVANNTYNATVRNGSAIINLENETPGVYDINVTYSGDDDHAGDSTTKYITIPKYGTEISIEVNSTVVGNVTRIIVTVPGNVTENVTIEIDGVKYNRTANGGKAVFDIEGLTAGNKTVTAIYDGDNWYVANSTTKQFTVSKVNSTIYTTGAAIDVDGTAVIDVYGPTDYNGTAVVTVNGVNYGVKLTNGVGQVNIAGLANGTYPIVVTYLENDKYFESTNDTSSIVVSKVASQVNVTVENINEGEPVIVMVTVPDDAIGNVTVKIGSIVKTLPVVGGENELIILDVPAGEYSVVVTYEGNDKYTGYTNDTAKLKVTKVVVDEIKVTDLGNGTIKVVVPDNTTGNVTVKVGDDIYNATVENGTAVIGLNKTLPGSHEITATFVGDDGTTKQIKATVMIPKYATPISINVSDANVGDNIRIVVTVKGNVTKEVTIEIDGEKYTKEVTNGETVFEINTLTAGNKTVTATYDGDEYYLFNSTTRNFTVSKLTAPISVSAVTSANNAVIALSGLPDDATGFVIVKVGDMEYGVNITQTKQLTVPLTKSGTYSVDVTYLGDNKYLGNTNSTSFAISIDDKVTIDVHEENYGEDVVVKVTVPEDAEGNITVKIGNTTKVVNVTGGENVITIPDVSSGSHEINVTYSGDSKYDTKTIVKTIYVYSSVNVEDEYTRGWNSPYDYSAEFLDSEGHVIKNTEVKFIVNGKTYTAKTNNQGVAYLTGSNLPVGTYEITTINPVTGQEVTKKVTIVKRILENKDLTKDYLDSKSYSVLVIGDDGKPVGAGEYVAMTINTVTYAVKTNEKGYAVRTIGLVPGSYTITASYKDCTVKNKVKVKQTLKSKSVKVKKSAKKLVLKATLKWSNGKAIAGKKVTFKLNGKTYSAKTNSKGIAQVTIKKSAIKKLKAGKKYTILIKYNDEKVKPKLTVKK